MSSVSWRLSVVLVPLASIALCAVAVVRMNDAGRFRPANLRRYVWGGLGAVLFCAAVGTAFTASKVLKPEPAYLGFVRANLASGQQYLTPPGLREFRLSVGAPQYVTFKSHPYQDIEVLEWHRRLKVALELYAGANMDCDALQRLAVEEAVTHLLVTSGNPTVSCGFASKIFADGNTQIFSLGRTTFAETGSRQ